MIRLSILSSEGLRLGMRNNLGFGRGGNLKACLDMEGKAFLFIVLLAFISCIFVRVRRGIVVFRTWLSVLVVLAVRYCFQRMITQILVILEFTCNSDSCPFKLYFIVFAVLANSLDLPALTNSLAFTAPTNPS